MRKADKIIIGVAIVICLISIVSSISVFKSINKYKREKVSFVFDLTNRYHADLNEAKKIYSIVQEKLNDDVKLIDDFYEEIGGDSDDASKIFTIRLHDMESKYHEFKIEYIPVADKWNIEEVTK